MTASIEVDEVVSLCKRLRLKYVREQVVDVIATAKAQRWEPTEVLRVLLGAEVVGRDRSTIETRKKRSGLPTGKTFDVWNSSQPFTSPAASNRALTTRFAKSPGTCSNFGRAGSRS